MQERVHGAAYYFARYGFGLAEELDRAGREVPALGTRRCGYNPRQMVEASRMRDFLLCWLWLCWRLSWAQAQQEPCAMAGNNNDFLGIQTIRLWPGDAPLAKGKACEDMPTLTIFEPQRGHGTARRW